MNNLVYIVGNWIFVAVIGISFLLIIRGWFYSFYQRIFYSFKFKPVWIFLAAVMVALIIWREVLVVPFSYVQSWLPGSSVPTQLVYWLYTTHILSILLFGGFIFLMWRKFDSLIPAVFVSWLALGVIEFSFIPQHLIMIRNFMGLDWYAPFFGLTVPFLLDRSKFQFNKKGLVFIAGALVIQCLLIFLYPWSMTVYDPTLRSFGINHTLFPEPPLISWIFMEFNHVIKIGYLAGFSFLELKK